MPSYLYPLLTVVQVIAALAVIVLVLLQQGKGADMGSSFGGGSAGSLFGATGAANFFSRATKWIAVLFFASTAGLAYLGNSSPDSVGGQSSGSGLMEGYQPQDPALPVAPLGGGAIPPAPVAGNAAVPVVPAAVGQSTPAAPEAVPAPATQATVVETPTEVAPVADKSTENTQ
ncbi:preprotein translocase subunit SecG [Advenella sp. RU8]|uniref:preprotein translocase subunit SecG n=1 Tax=Advenella sp. RU8 TaxID=3399575 RepID=UPI003AAC0DC3